MEHGKGRLVNMIVKLSIIEAVESETGNKDLAFKVYNLIKFQRFTELDEEQFNLLNLIY